MLICDVESELHSNFEMKRKMFYYFYYFLLRSVLKVYGTIV